MFAAAIVFQMCASTVFAAGDLPNLDEARRLLDEGKAEQAAAILEGDLLSRAGDADYDYLLGLAWYRSGQTGKAMFAFERVLMADPRNEDARLKAAQISAGRGDAAYARELLVPLEGQPLATAQQQELEKIRAAIKEAAMGGTLSVRGYLLGGCGADDNVTSGPAQSELLIPALGTTPFALGTARKGRDIVGTLEGGLSLQQAVGEDTWLTGESSLHQGFNRLRKDVTESYVNLNLGVLRRSGREFFGAAVLAQDFLLANANYRTTLGGRLNWIHAFDNDSLLTAYVQHLAFDYSGNALDNATRSIAGFTHETTFGDDAGTVQYGVYGGRELAANQAHFSYHQLGGSVGGSVAAGKDLAFSAGVVYEKRGYDAVDALYLYTRSDAAVSAGIAADYRLSERWHFIPRYTYTRNISNMALYDYTRNAFTLQLRWDFDNEKN